MKNVIIMENIMLMEDADFKVYIPCKGFVPGEILIESVNHLILEELSDDVVAKAFQVANRMSGLMFETMGCHGTNVLIQNGVPSGQVKDKFCVRVIPRFDGDSLNLGWDAKSSDVSDLDSVVGSFKDVDEDSQKQKYFEDKRKELEDKKVDVLKDSSESDNYLLKSLRRNP